MIELKKISIKNFLSIEDLEIDIKPGFHLIHGRNHTSEENSSNGSGKSSILESIAWCFYKYTGRNEVSRENQGDTSVSINGLFDGMEYTITRYRNHKKYGNNVTIQKEGGEISTPNIRIANKEVEDMIRIPLRVFLSSIVIPQNSLHGFTSLEPTVRKTVLEEITGFNWWDDIRPKFSKEISNISNELSEIKGKKEQLERNIDSTKDSISKLNNPVEKEQNTASDEDLRKLETRIQGLKETMREMFPDPLMTEKRLRKLEETNTLTKNEIRQYERLIHEKRCPTCNQEYSKEILDNAYNQVSELQQNLQVLDEKLRKAQDELISYQRIERKLRDVENEKYRIELSLESQKKVDLYRDRNANTVKTLQEEIEKQMGELESINLSLFEITKRLNILKSIDSELLPSSQFRTDALNKFIEVLNTGIRDICLSVSDNFIVSIVGEKKGLGFKVEHRGREIPYSNLSGGEKKRIDVILLLSLQKFFLEVSGNSSNVIVFDEIFDGIDHAGVSIIIETIKNLFDENTCVFVITHNDQVKSMFESSIFVEKLEDNKSYYDFSEYV